MPADGDSWDLSSTMFASPVARAGRRLEELLLENSVRRELKLVPPETTTIGQIASRFIVPGGQVADETILLELWAAAIRAATSTDRAMIMGVTAAGSTPPGSIESASEMLSRMHSDLAGACMQFKDVADRLQEQGADASDQWHALSRIEGLFLDHAESCNIDVPHRMEMQAIAGERTVHVEGIDTLLIIAADMVESRRRFLGLLGERGIQVSNLVHASEEEDGALFDEDGCIDIMAFGSLDLHIDTGIIRVGDLPGDQVAIVLDEIDANASELSTEDITIGVLDQELSPILGLELESRGLPTSSAEPDPVSTSSVGRFLHLLESHLHARSPASLEALLLHPDVERFVRGTLSKPDHWIPTRIIREYVQVHQPSTLAGPLVHGSQGRQLQELIDAIDRLTGSIEGVQLPLHEWSEQVASVLTRLHEHPDPHLDEQQAETISSALDRVTDVLVSWTSMPAALAWNRDAASALSVLNHALVSSPMRSTVVDGSISFQGWLDCHLDDSRMLLLTGFNEEFVPAASTSDPFLPDSLRTDLGLVDDARRYARDAWLLKAILDSDRMVRIITGSRGGEGDPLRPSRLLLTGDGLDIARVLDECWYGNKQESQSLDQWRMPSATGDLFLPYPDPGEGEPITSMSVTSFRRYIECPYRFRLERQSSLRLDCSDEDLHELGPADFGNICHEVLEQWGRSEIKRATPTEDQKQIFADLSERLDGIIRTRLDAARPEALAQMEMLRNRLEKFSHWQARRGASGWKVHAVELDFSMRSEARCPAVAFPGNERMRITGTVDRVDHNPDLGIYQALDYKTSSSGRDPMNAHGKPGQWKDLQLPLYRFLLDSIGIPVEGDALGYVNIAADPSAPDLGLASWSDSDIEDAMDCAGQIIDRVLAGDFQHSGDPPDFPGILDPICGNGVLLIPSEREVGQ